MLSKAAEAALLKTLEEPPPHVVFVLATTDPQKVSDTIRSRTQHLRFHLLPTDALAEHVRWVAADAGLDVDDAAIDAAVAQGGGSARDTLSALELIASAGGDAGDALSFDEFVEALIEHDPGRALTALAHAVARRPRAAGARRGPRPPPPRLLPVADGARARAAVGPPGRRPRRPGAAPRPGGARAGDRAARRDPRRAAPRPRPAGARRGRPRAADDGTAGRQRRRHRRRSPPGSAASSRRSPTGHVPTPSVAAPVDPATGRTQLGGRARRAADASGPIARPEPAAARTCRGARGAGAAAPAPPRRPTTSAPSGPRLKPTLKGMARAVFTPVDVVGAGARHDHARRAQRHPPRQVRRAPQRRRAGLHRRPRADDHHRADRPRRPAGPDRRATATGRRRRRPRRPRRRPAGLGAVDHRSAGPGVPRLRAHRAGPLTWRAPTPRPSRR